MLQIKNLTVDRGLRPLFQPINFQLDPGEVLHVSGNNGAGKSTLLMTLAGLLPLKNGEIIWNNSPITSESRFHFLNEIFYLGHQIGIKGQLTVYENTRFFQFLQPCDPLINEQILLSDLGLLNLRDTLAYQLSAGQKQRTALMRLWLTKAKLWLLDEPFNALDTLMIEKVVHRIAEHCQSGGAVVLTSHLGTHLPDHITIKSIQL